MNDPLSPAELKTIEDVQRHNEEWKQICFVGFQAWSAAETSLAGIFAWAMTGKNNSDSAVPAYHAFRATRSLEIKIRMTSAALGGLAMSDDLWLKWTHLENRLNRENQIQEKLTHDLLYGGPIHPGGRAVSRPQIDDTAGGCACGCGFDTGETIEAEKWIRSMKLVCVAMNAFEAELFASEHRPRPREQQTAHGADIHQPITKPQLVELHRQV